MQLFSKMVIRARMIVMRAAPNRGPSQCDDDFANQSAAEKRQSGYRISGQNRSLQVVGYGLRVNRAAGEVGS